MFTIDDAFDFSGFGLRFLREGFTVGEEFREFDWHRDGSSVVREHRFKLFRASVFMDRGVVRRVYFRDYIRETFSLVDRDDDVGANVLPKHFVRAVFVDDVYFVRRKAGFREHGVDVWSHFLYFVELRRWIRDVLFVFSFKGYD
jgi:hypothetical protein